MRLRQILIITFCLWHMFAVGAYLLPRNVDGTLGDAMKNAKQWSAGYVLLLSQWQKWDIFAPDPLRKSSTYRIDRNAGDRLETAIIIDADHLGFFERAKEIKILERIETEQWNALAAPYLRAMCPRISNSAGTELSLVSVWSILPKELSSLTQLSKQHLGITEKILGTYRCKRSS